MKRSKRSKRALVQVKAQRGLDRKHFFEQGGEMVRWRGLRLVQQDKKKARNKRACRLKVRV